MSEMCINCGHLSLEKTATGFKCWECNSIFTIEYLDLDKDIEQIADLEWQEESKYQ